MKIRTFRYICSLPFWLLAFIFAAPAILFEIVAKTIDPYHEFP